MLSIIVAVAMIASTGTSIAATTKPSPKPKTKASAAPKITKKAAPKKTAKKKPVHKKTTTKKKTATKKKPVYKRKVVKVTPSPSPTWPPKGFRANGEVYAKVPTNTELLGILSATPALASQVKTCTKYACGAVTIASTTGCTWWEIKSTVSGPLSATDTTSVPYGTLRTTAKGTKRKQIVTVLLVSTEPLKSKVTVNGIDISCYHSPVTEKIPSNVYTPNAPTPTPSPSDTTESPTPTATPTATSNTN